MAITTLHHDDDPAHGQSCYVANERSALQSRVAQLERFITQMSGMVHASSHGEPFETCPNGLCKAARAALRPEGEGGES